MPEVEQAAAQPREEQQSRFTSIIAFISRMVLVYFVINWFKGGSNTNVGQQRGGMAQVSQCLWPLGTPMELQVFVSETAEYQLFPLNLSARIIHEQGLRFGDWSEDQYRTISTYLPAEERITKQNGSLYAHIYINRADKVFNERSTSKDVIYKRQILTRYLPKKKIVETRNLLDANQTTQLEKKVVATDDNQIVSYWYPNVTINIIADASALPVDQIRTVPALHQNIQFTSADFSSHLPLVYLNQFWTMRGEVYSRPLNETVEQLELHVDWSPLSMWKFQMMVQMDESFRLQTSMFGSSEMEIDQIKQMLFDTNPYLLVLTFTVSLLHSIFDFLAFKNDIQFWKDKKSLEGISVRTISLNIILQAIIFLYLLDNETSWLIIVSNGIGLLIELWKIRKALVVEIDRSKTFWISFKDKNPQSEMRKKTDEYDALAFKYLGWVLIPLVIGYSVYSLIYESHKGWYSWTLSTLVGFVYAFGFIALCPQLFINYKLKSVAHMPWKTFMYKALNTFVDDLFAFVIKMPLLHRLACFRDDLVFLVYLYQRYKYRVDKTRVNEFGQVGEQPEEDKTQHETQHETIEDKKTK